MALGSPLAIRSAPIFFPLLGQPDLRRNKLLITPQEQRVKQPNTRIQKNLLRGMWIY
jgi:hypothetical protein